MNKAWQHSDKMNAASFPTYVLVIKKPSKTKTKPNHPKGTVPLRYPVHEPGQTDGGAALSRWVIMGCQNFRRHKKNLFF